MSSSEDCWKYAWVNNLLGHLTRGFVVKYCWMQGRRRWVRGERISLVMRKGEREVWNHRAICGEIDTGKIKELQSGFRKKNFCIENNNKQKIVIPCAEIKLSLYSIQMLSWFLV